jgi:tRNA pseudouridine55 synthase
MKPFDKLYSENLNGVLNIFKEKGYTSRDAVNIISKKFGKIKAGHAGTLDPAARGVLVVCLGNAVKIAEYITSGVKEYIAEIVLGITTDTYDITGNVLERAEPFFDGSVLERFKGKIAQGPPMFSALKQGGKRLYDLARRGIEVERAPRQVEIFSLDVLNIKNNIVAVKVECSKGTYIRSLCADIGEALGCGAAMGELTRTRSGNFYAKDSISIEAVKNSESADIIPIIPIQDALDFNKITLPERFDKALRNGAKITLENSFDGENVLVFSSGGKLGGIYKVSGALLVPVKIFNFNAAGEK